MNEERYTGLVNLMNQALERVQGERGFQLPLYVTMVGSNGVMSMYVYEDVGEPRTRVRIVAEYEPEETMAWPIHGLIVETEGEGAHIVFPSANAMEFRD